MLLMPVGFVAYACVAFGSKWELFLSYRFSHSNPHVRIFYLSLEARDILRSRVYSTRTESLPEAGDAQATVPTVADAGDSHLESSPTKSLNDACCAGATAFQKENINKTSEFV